MGHSQIRPGFAYGAYPCILGIFAVIAITSIAIKKEIKLDLSIAQLRVNPHTQKIKLFQWHRIIQVDRDPGVSSLVDNREARRI